MDEYTVQLGKRMSLLESRVAQLEDTLFSFSTTHTQTSPAPASKETGEAIPPKPAVSTRARSIQFLKKALQENNIKYEISGSRKIGVRNRQGTLIPIYLSVSRDYSDDPSSVRGWNTIKDSVIQDENYLFYIISIEDASSKPTYFVFTKAELRNLRESSDVDKNQIVHFYFGWDLPDGKPFSYPRNRKFSKQPLDQYKNAWIKFESYGNKK